MHGSITCSMFCNYCPCFKKYFSKSVCRKTFLLLTNPCCFFNSAWEKVHSVRLLADMRIIYYAFCLPPSYREIYTGNSLIDCDWGKTLLFSCCFHAVFMPFLRHMEKGFIQNLLLGPLND